MKEPGTKWQFLLEAAQVHFPVLTVLTAWLPTSSEAHLGEGRGFEAPAVHTWKRERKEKSTGCL